MNVSDILRTKGSSVITLRTDETVKVAVQTLAANKIGAVVVEDHAKPIGIFSERDLVNGLAKYGHSVLDRNVGDMMSAPMITGHADDRIETALSIMTSHRIRHLPIFQDHDLVGLVSIGDLVKQRLDDKELEANVLLDISRMRS